ncbi:serine-rich adhesin for platelets isoform X4 [Bradysia coprophila]|uniref:serine-rich adhesin for platelets isoform X4 n=1 Tax=Bradysia coprophila TaxID=38358 RepID=UPI00187D7D89|nr:serine-rich adhesin for platelets isoform X4 [Bradysia coprophila]
MESKGSIDSKIGGDAIREGSASAGNLSSNVTNMNPLLKDSKRVIKKMIVMDTSKLKGLGIESTIKNAMSKLGKERNIKIEKPTSNTVDNQSINVSPKVPQTIIKTEFEPNNVTVKPAATVIKHIYRPGVPFSATSDSTTDPVHIQSKGVTAKPSSTHPVIHSPRQSLTTSTNNVSFRSSNETTPPASVTKNVAQSACVPNTSTNSMQPIRIASTGTVPVVKGHRNGPTQFHYNAAIVPSQTNNPVIKVESTAPSAASDGKKIKVLSNVSLIDGKSKLLEIDKLSSKNLKFTNVIKGTDKSPPKAAVLPNSDSGSKPDSHSNAVPGKMESDRVTKFTHVIKGSEERQPRTTVAAPCTVSSTRAPVFIHSSMPKYIQTETKLTSSVNLKPLNDGKHQSTTRLIFHKQHGTPAMPTKIDEPKFSSKSLKNPSDATNKTIPPNILNFSNVGGGNALRSDFINQSFRSSYPAGKSIKTEIDTVPSKNLIFTNASRPVVQIITAIRKSTTPTCSSSAPIKTEFEEMKPNDFNQPNAKGSKEYPSHNVGRPAVCKVAKPVTSTSSTSAATEVATKQLVTTDENVEIYKPSAQKYLSKSTVSTEMTPVDNAARNKRFHDAVWSTNNPRTYARHNIKRLLSDKIIKKRKEEESVQNFHNEQTSETVPPVQADKSDVHGDASASASDLNSEKEKSKTELPTKQPTPIISELTSADDGVQSPVKLPVEPPIQPMVITSDSEPLQNSPIKLVPTVDDTVEPMDVTTDSEKIKPVQLEAESPCNQTTPSPSKLTQIDDSVEQPPIPPVDVNTDAVTVTKNNFCGFSIEEVNVSFSLLTQIKAILSKNRPKKTLPLLVSTNPKVGSEREIKLVVRDNNRWVLNHETGVLEEKFDIKMKSIQQNVPPSTEADMDSRLSRSNLDNVNELIEPSEQTLKNTELESGLSPSKTPVIEDADDEISDIDLFHRSKTKCTGSAMNRRAIFKSIELHRKSALPATTDDDESELSLRVRPPRPKLRRSRQKQTLEQLKVQQNAHVSLLKRFIRTDSDCDNLDEEVLMSFIGSVDQRIEVLENQVKNCFKKKICAELNVDAISVSEQSVTTFVDLMKDIDGPVKSCESVTRPDLVKPSKSSSNVHSRLSGGVTCNAQLPEGILPSNAETAESEHRQGLLKIHEVTIRKDTFLVTEYDNQCDKINHLPLNVKLEKDTSTKRSISAPPPVRKTTKPTIRKKRKRKSLVEMLAKHVDKETLKSVIIEHAKQKCDLSSSLDSDSDNDSDRGDVVSKIFRTVCTIDLCDDDDETVHEDVLQYLEFTEENEMEIEQDVMSVNPSYSVETKINHEVPKPIKSPKPSCKNPRKGKLETRTSETSGKKRNPSSTTVIDTPIEGTIENAESTAISAKEHDDMPVANICDENPPVSTLETSNVSLLTATTSNVPQSTATTSNVSPSTVTTSNVPLSTATTSNVPPPIAATSNVSLTEAESISSNFFDDDDHTETLDTAFDVEASTSPSPDNTLKVDEMPSPKVEAVPQSKILKSDGNSVSEIADKNDIQEGGVVPSDDQSKMEKIVPATVPKISEEVTTVTIPMDNISAAKDPEQPMNVEASPAAPSNTKIDKSPEKKSPKRLIIKLRPFEEISCRPRLKSIDNEPTAGAKLSFAESLSKIDSAIDKGSKSKRKASKSKDAHTTDTIDYNLYGSRLIVVTPETLPKSTERKPKDKIQLSSESINDDPAVGPIKIKIKIGKEPKNSAAIPNNDTVNGIEKPSRSRKRKSAVLEDAASVPVATPPPASDTTRRRPIFDNFDSPEILTTKRARKSKSYVDDDDRIENVPTTTQPLSNSRSSKRKSNSSKSPLKLESSVLETVDGAKDQKDLLATEPVSIAEPNAELNTERNIEPNAEPNAPPKVPIALTMPKTGRGIRPPVLAPLDVAERYVCGNCKEVVEAKDWTKHIRGHYGLSWRVDVDPPIDMDNIHTMSSKVLNFIKKANIKILKCPQCDVEKKSALGYLSHLEVCGLTPEEVKSKLVKCEHCPSMIRSCSMKIHLTFCSGLKRLLQKEKESTKEPDSAEECYNDMGRAVRRSAQKAMSSFKDLGKAPEAKLEDYVERVEKISNKQHRKWRQVLKEGNNMECVRKGCEFSTNDLLAMVDHFNTCVLVDGETFYCNRCGHGPDTRADVEEHIKASHSLGVIESIDDKIFSDSDDDAELGEESSESEGESGDEERSDKDGGDSDFDDEDDDGWNTKGYKKKRLRDWPHNEVMLNSCLDRKVLAEYANLLKSYSGGSYYYPTLEWTQDFRDTHFSSEGLLPTATPNTFSVLSSTLTDLYLPRVQQSNKFLVKDVRKYRKVYGSTEITQSDSWKLLNRFEASIESDCMVLFTGGPVLSMAWLPVPDDHLSQILAVCCRSDANDDILMNNTRAAKCLIQLWNFHKLKNGQLRHAQIPHLLYSVAYDHGPIIQLEFCPSGGFTEDRLGLLAVSSYDGHVDILALPKNFTCDNSKIENLVFTIKPSLTLCCERDRPFGVLMTKLVWSQSMGHTKLAGGFANGLVAIWNLKNLETPFTCSKINGIPTLLPTDLFFAGNKAIKLLEFHHDENNDARWLIAGSHDRKVKFFDTHNVHLEISTTTAHSRITAGCWPVHWTSFLLGIDNAYSLKISGIILKQPLDIGCRTSTFYSCIGSTCDISFNNWLNSYVFVTSYGDIHVGYVRQMISGFGETRRQRSILGYTDSVDISGSDSREEEDVANEEVSTSDEPQPSTSAASAIESAADFSYPSTDGIVFCDFRNPLPAVTSPSYEKIGAPPMNKYNMVKVNRVVFNPNVSAYKLYALGYESGFVRINQLLPN